MPACRLRSMRHAWTTWSTAGASGTVGATKRPSCRWRPGRCCGIAWNGTGCTRAAWRRYWNRMWATWILCSQRCAGAGCWRSRAPAELRSGVRYGRAVAAEHKRSEAMQTTDPINNYTGSTGPCTSPSANSTPSRATSPGGCREVPKWPQRYSNSGFVRSDVAAGV